MGAASLGTETDGSIVSPASACGVVGIKPTVGLTSRFNVIPISETQDTVGPHARTMADAAAVLSAISGPDPLDAATENSVLQDFTEFLDPDGLVGANIGVARDLFGVSPEADAIAEQAVQAMADAGANIIEMELGAAGEGGAELEVLLFELKDGMRRYLARLAPSSPKRLQDPSISTTPIQTRS